MTGEVLVLVGGRGGGRRYMVQAQEVCYAHLPPCSLGLRSVVAIMRCGLMPSTDVDVIVRLPTGVPTLFVSHVLSRAARSIPVPPLP